MEDTQREALKKIVESESPLMKRFKDLAPGTVKHCQNVANFCESVAIELGLDVDLIKSAALIHDIGKMFNADHFTENQTGKNVHDEFPPETSYHLLTRHVSDSVLVAVNAGVPIGVIELIGQHHGDTVLSSIYSKAKKENSNVEDDFYRYKSSKPQTTEAAILMIVDSVEATTRALFNNGTLGDSKNRKRIINSTIEKLEDDKQLDELKLGVVRVIKEVLHKEIDSMYHKRITYDEVDDKKEDE